MKKYSAWLFLFPILIFLGGCSAPPPGTATPPPPAPAVTRAAPALPPTFTPLPGERPSATPRPTASPAPTSDETPIPFDETAVELRYLIPAISLERRLQGNVASQIIFVDETTGRGLQRSNQAGVLLELQQALPELELPPVPEGCERCVNVSYQLPLSDLADEGWMDDPVLLASVENLMAAVLGPHFPPGTILGLRRSASPYAPAHTVALTEEGQLWLWLATEAEIDEPLAVTAVAPDLPAQLQALSLDELESSYQADCPGVPRETLLLNPGGGPLDLAEETGRQIAIACPAFTLPSTLLPAYAPLDDLLADKLAEVEGPPRPPDGFPLTALLDYRRADGARLTIYQDGLVQAEGINTPVLSDTIPAGQAISLTTSLIEAEAVQPGLTSFGPEEAEGEGTVAAPRSRLLVRGPGGVYDAAWRGGNTAVAPVEALLAALLPEAINPELTPTVAPTATVTITPTVVP